MNDRVFTIIDKRTGEEVDIDTLVDELDLKTELMINDIEGFAIGERGEIYLLDECGNFVFVDPDNYEVRMNNIQ